MGVDAELKQYLIEMEDRPQGVREREVRAG